MTAWRVGDDQDQVAGLGVEPLAELRPELAAGRTWRSGRSAPSASTLSQTRPLAPNAVDELGQAVEVLAAVLARRRRRADALDPVAADSRRAGRP